MIACLLVEVEMAWNPSVEINLSNIWKTDWLQAPRNWWPQGCCHAVRRAGVVCALYLSLPLSLSCVQWANLSQSPNVSFFMFTNIYQVKTIQTTDKGEVVIPVTITDQAGKEPIQVRAQSWCLCIEPILLLLLLSLVSKIISAPKSTILCHCSADYPPVSLSGFPLQVEMTWAWVPNAKPAQAKI